MEGRSEKLLIHAVDWDDVYLAYKPAIRWEGEQPPQPTFWKHQLNSADPKLLLGANPTRLSTEVGKLLSRQIEFRYAVALSRTQGRRASPVPTLLFQGVEITTGGKDSIVAKTWKRLCADGESIRQISKAI